MHRLIVSKYQWQNGEVHRAATDCRVYMPQPLSPNVSECLLWVGVCHLCLATIGQKSPFELLTVHIKPSEAGNFEG